MTHHSRTLHDLFEEARPKLVNGYRWCDYWADRWKEHIEEYKRLGWHLMRLPHFSKRPYNGSEWASMPLPYDRALKDAIGGDNIAAVMHDMVLIDSDVEEMQGLENMIPLTRTSRTPRGYAFWTRGPFVPSLWQRLKKKYEFLDNPRSDIMYAVVPLSQAHIRSNHGRVRRVQPRVYEWASTKDPVSFKLFVKEALLL